jgi:hypothetical protein
MINPNYIINKNIENREPKKEITNQPSPTEENREPNTQPSILPSPIEENREPNTLPSIQPSPTEENREPNENDINMENEKYKILLQDKIGCLYVDDKEIPQKYITKLQINNKVLENEWKTAEKIKTIANYPLYFAPILTNEQDIHIGELNEVIQSECSIITDPPTYNSSAEYATSKIKYVGKYSLQPFLNKINRKYPHKLLPQLIDAHIQLLTSIEKLQEKNLIHMDIKGNNILYDDIEGRFILIDFGFTIDTKEIDFNNSNKFFYQYSSYSPWCIEIFFLSNLPDSILDGEITGGEINNKQNQQPVEEKKENDSIGQKDQTPVEEKKENDSIGQSVESSVGQSVESSVGQSVESSVGQSVESSVGQSVESPKEEKKENDSIGQKDQTPIEVKKENDSIGQSVESSVGQSVESPKEEKKENDSIGQSVESSIGQSVESPVGQSVESPKEEKKENDSIIEEEPQNVYQYKTILSTFFGSYILEQIEDGERKTKFQKEAEAYFKSTFQNKTKEETYNTIITYANTWDNYSLAITFLKLIHNHYPTQPKIIQSYKNILYDIIFAMPNTRPNVKTIKEKIIKLFSNISHEDYKEYLHP